MLTVNKIPVPDPIAPKKSAMTVKKPIKTPPSVAAVLIKYFNCCLVL